jgi:FKBP-type peptidyl-prolyl cis-trans isomerase SlyD
MKISENNVVKLHFSVMDKDHNTFDSSFDKDPLECVIGSGFLIPGLEKALFGRESGDVFSTSVKAIDAYGERNDNLTQAVPKSMFEGMEINVGMQFRASTDEGEQTVVIIGIEGDDVVVDGNHPLAGVDLTFDVEVIDVRDATEEELSSGQVGGKKSCCSSEGDCC